MVKWTPKTQSCGAGHQSDVDVVGWHPNSHYVATGSSDRSIRLWDIRDASTARVFVGHRSPVRVAVHHHCQPHHHSRHHHFHCCCHCHFHFHCHCHRDTCACKWSCKVSLATELTSCIQAQFLSLPSLSQLHAAQFA